ncbi:MAG: tetratricopeptide repeat protein [Thermodesulfobacteriota bacterium]
MVVFAVCLISLIAVNAGHIADPPYWDSIFVYSQAAWLKDHDFDVPELARQPGYEEGGPHINYMYALVLGIAVLYRFLSPPLVFLVMHVFTFFCAALLCTWFLRLLIDFIKPLPAVLWCLAAVSQPILSGQSAAIYLELPLAAGTGAIILALHRQNYFTVFVVSILMYFIKPSIMILGLALFGFAWVNVCLERWMPLSSDDAAKSGVWWLMVPFPAYWMLEKIRVSSMPTELHFDFLTANFRYLWGGCPDLMVISAAAVILATIDTFTQWPLIIRDRLKRNRFYLILLLGLFIFGFWISLLLFQNPLYRYSTFIVFPLFGLLAILSTKAVPQGATLPALFFIVFHLLNQWGAFLPSPPESLRRSGETLERSREYLEDLKAHQALFRTIQQDLKDRNIAAKYPYIQMLTMPELGYVEKPLPHVFSVTIHPDYTPARMITSPVLFDPDTVYFYAQNIFEATFSPSLTPGPHDAILAMDGSLGGVLTLYERGRDWLNPMNNPRQAKDWTTMLYGYGNLLLSKKDYHKAVEYYTEALSLNTPFSDLYNNLGAALFRLRKYDEAARQFQKTLELEPGSVEAGHNLRECIRFLERENS